ncbi:Zinc-ribbon domain-containing protein [uncultured virus]|nr:Zinc-ribbon domain-containing protein [uncultured virus]
MLTLNIISPVKSNNSNKLPMVLNIARTTDCDGKCGQGKYINRRWTCPHNSLAAKYPGIAAEWDYVKNGNKRPEDYRCGSDEYVWWICSKEGVCECHGWPSKINNRTREQQSGCPFCNSGKICKHYNLQAQYPDIAAQWDYEQNVGNPQDYSPYASYNAWWKCDKGHCNCHKWNVSIHARTSGSSVTGCPFCSDPPTKVCIHKNLATGYPEIMNEWDYELNDKRPETYHGSSHAQVWWKCFHKPNKIHSYLALIRNRTYSKSGCSCHKKSHGENKIAEILMKLGINFEPQWNKIIQLGRKRFDFFLPNEKVIIEYDGIQHFEIHYFCKTTEKFAERRQTDIEKQNAALRLGYKIIRIDYTIPFDQIENHIIRALNEKKSAYYSTPTMYQWL